MPQDDDDGFVLPSRGTLQRLKEDRKVDKEIDEQLSGLAASSEIRARLAETSRAQKPAPGMDPALMHTSLPAAAVSTAVHLYIASSR